LDYVGLSREKIELRIKNKRRKQSQRGIILLSWKFIEAFLTFQNNCKGKLTLPLSWGHLQIQNEYVI
jgi:hypothetical protein